MSTSEHEEMKAKVLQSAQCLLKQNEAAIAALESVDPSSIIEYKDLFLKTFRSPEWENLRVVKFK